MKGSSSRSRRIVWVILVAALFCSLGCDNYKQYNAPGLYYHSSILAKTDFEFERRPMRGLTINHYADGCYYVRSTPGFIQSSDPITLHIVPNRPVTFGGADDWKGSAFEVKRSIAIYRVADDGHFVCVTGGRRSGDAVACGMTMLVDKVEEARGGLVKHRKQLIEFDFGVPKGKYVIFEGEGNVFDKDTYPTKDQQCWFIQVL